MKTISLFHFFFFFLNQAGLYSSSKHKIERFCVVSTSLRCRSFKTSSTESLGPPHCYCILYSIPFYRFLLFLYLLPQKKKKKKNEENGFLYCASFIHSISFWVYTCIKNFPVIKFKLNRAGLSNRLLEITSRHLLTKNWVQTWICITELLGLKDTLRSLSPIPLHVDTIADLFIRCLWWSMHVF